MPIDDSNGVLEGSGPFYEHVLNNMFLSAVADTVITPNTLSTRVARDATRVEGKNIVFPIHVGRNVGVSSVGPDGELPDPGSQDYNSYSFPVRSLYGRIKFGGLNMDASSSDVASWLRVIAAEVKGLGLDMSRQKQRQMHGDGSGALAETRGATITGSQSFINVSCYSGTPNSSTTDLPDGRPTKHLKVGQVIAVINNGAGTGAPVNSPSIAYVGKITAINDDGDNSATSAQIAVSPNIGGGGNIVAGAYIVAASNTALEAADSNEDLESTAYQNESMGLAGIVQDSNPDDGVTGFQGVDASAVGNEWNRSQVSTIGSIGPLTRTKMDELFTSIIENGDAVPTAIYGGFGFVREYAALCIDAVAGSGTDGRRRFNNTTEFDDGYTGLSYTGVPVFADRDTIENRCYMTDETDLKQFVMTDPTWMSMDGSIYSRLSNKDAYQATMYCRETLGSEVRDRHGLLTQVDEA